MVSVRMSYRLKVIDQFIVCILHDTANMIESKQSSRTSRGLDFGLQTIYPHEVTIDKASKKNIQILKEFLLNFEHKCIGFSPLFQRMFQKFYCTGSAFEGLQVKEAIEFDINVVLHFPFSGDTFHVKEIEKPSSFAVFQLTQPIASLLENEPCSEIQTSLPSLFDCDNFLLGRKLLSWFQSVVDKYLTLGSFKAIKSVEKVKRTNSGPACTLKIKLTDVWISIDLVPVFGFDTKNYLWNVVFHDHIINREVMSTFCLVPKPLKQVEVYEVNKEDSQRLWRIHFPEAEKKVLIGRSSLKPVIKLVKRLRDKENWPIASYFIKTVAISIVTKHPDLCYFADSELGGRFIEVLNSLREHLSAGHLGHIFYPKFNLLQRMKANSRIAIANRLQKIISEIHKNPSCTKILFRCSKYTTVKKMRSSYKNKLKDLHF